MLSLHKESIDYKRRKDLEGNDNNLVITELGVSPKYLIIIVYRSFSIQNNVSLLNRFTTQIILIKNAIISNLTSEAILLGDFNLNHALNHNINYNYKSFFEPLNELTLSLNLTQLINFPTWSRVVNGVTKESILDHIYIKDPTIIKNLSSRTPEVGHHKLLTCSINSNPVAPKLILKRNWRN